MVITHFLPSKIFSRLFSRKNTGSLSGEDLVVKQVNALRGSRKFLSFSQLQQLPRILTAQEKKLFTGGSVLFFFGVLLLLFGGLSTLFMSIPKPGGTLTEGMLGYPQLINPLYADANTVDKELSTLVYSGLLAFNPATQSLEPDLAESWSLSEDEKTYTCVLKNNVTWQNGEPFGAGDVIFTFAAIQNAEYGSPLFAAYQNVAVTQTDERTLTFTLAEPYAAFPELLTVGILPAHLWEEISPANARLAALNLKPVGTGPYILEKTSKDSKGIIRSISFQSNETYHGTHPYINEIAVKFFSSSADVLQALQNKRIDTTASLSLNDALTLRDDSAFSIAPLPLPQYVGAFFNTKKELLNKSDMRKALTLALDVPAITADATGNLGTPTGFAIPGFLPTAASVQDVQTAASLLDSLGWTLNDAGKRAKDGTELTLTITTTEHTELMRAAEQVANAWRNMGITVTVTTLNNADATGALREKQYDVLIAAEQYGTIADPYPFWHSSGNGAAGFNMSQFSTTAMDIAVSTLHTSSSPDKRSEAFLALNQELITSLPVAFLFQNVLPLIHSVDILGISPQTLSHVSDRWTLERVWYKRTGLAWKF